MAHHYARANQSIKVDSCIRACAKVLEIIENKPGQYRLKVEVNIEIKGNDKPAIVAEWISIQMVK